MLKKFIALICAFAMLASCSGTPGTSTAPSVAPSESPSTTPSDGQTSASSTAGPSPSPTTASPTVAASPTPEPIEITPRYSTGRGDIVDGFFTVRLPESWRDKYIVEHDETDTTYGLSFYQKAAKDAGFGGWLFTLTSFPEDVDYSQYPQYELVGVIRSAGGFDEYLVAIYPSDVQFDEPQREQYTAMYADIPSILGGITVAEGCELIPKDELNLWSYDIPENHGMDSAVLERLHSALEQTKIYTLVVVRGGVIVDELYREGYDASTLIDIHSASKSVTAIMFGLAVEQGYIDSDLDRPISEYFPQIEPSSAWAKVTIRHLLTHTSGMSWNEYDANTNWEEWRTSENWVDYVLSRPIVRTPGTFFNYTTGGTHLLGAIIEKAVGCPLAEYTDEYLFEPMGITDYEWGLDPQGICDAGNGLRMNPRDMAKFGQLMLKRGRWNGEQLVPAEWVDECTSIQYRRSGGYASYGYQFWVKDFGDGRTYRTYFAQGAWGQLIFVQPELNLVCVMTSMEIGNTHAPWSYYGSYVLGAITEQ